MVIAPPGAPWSVIASFPDATHVPLSSGSAGAPVQVIALEPPPAPLLEPVAPPLPELEVVPDEVSLLPPQATRPAHITEIVKARRMERSIRENSAQWSDVHVHPPLDLPERRGLALAICGSPGPLSEGRGELRPGPPRHRVAPRDGGGDRRRPHRSPRRGRRCGLGRRGLRR